MRNRKLTLIASLITMLVVLLALTAVFPVQASALETDQASWGVDENNLTESGDLQSALSAAAAVDSTVGYIRLNTDLDLGEGDILASGGKFTLDLNGHTITSNAYTFYIYTSTDIIITDTAGGGGAIKSTADSAAAIMTDNTDVKIRLEGGTIEGFSCAFYTNSTSSIGSEASEAEITIAGGRVATISDLGYAFVADCKSIKFTGGTLDCPGDEFLFLNGIIDFSEYPDPSLITICSSMSEDLDLPSDTLLIPEGYSLYLEGEKTDALVAYETHTIDRTKYTVTVEESENGAIELSTSDKYLLPGTTVSLTSVPADGYCLGDIEVVGASYDPETQSFVILDSDVTVSATFKPHQADWGTDENNLTKSGTLEEALEAAAYDDSVGYIRVVRSVDLGNDYIMCTGGDFTFDLNGKSIRSESYTLYVNNSTDITIVDTVGEGSIVSYTDGASAILVDETAVKLRIEGGTFEGYYYALMPNSGSYEQLSLAEITIIGGTFITRYYQSSAIMTNFTLTTIEGGNFDSGINIGFCGGTLDLSRNPDPSGLTLESYTGADIPLPSENIKLPEGYGFYEGDNLSNTLLKYTLYTVEFITFDFAYLFGENGSVTSSHPDGKLAPGTVVTFDITPNDGYLTDVYVQGATYNHETNSITVLDQDVTVTFSFKPFLAKWGTDKDNLTNRGTFEEAIANVVDGGYIQLVANVENRASYYTVNDVSFTLDLCGFNISALNYGLFVGHGASLILIDTVGGGKLIGDYYGLNMSGNSLTLESGILEGEFAGICWANGSIDLSNYDHADSLTFKNETNEIHDLPADSIKLPEKHTVYHNTEKVTQLINNSIYTVGLEKFNIEISDCDGLSIYLSTDPNAVLPGTLVYVDYELLDNYVLNSILVNGGDVELSLDDESGRYYFTMPESDVTISAVSKHIAFTWGMSEESLTNTGDLNDLVVAINSGEAPYAKLIDSYSDLTSSDFSVISGKSIIDLNGFVFSPESTMTTFIELAEGADITLYSDRATDDLEYSNDIYVDFYLHKGSKLVLDGVYSDSLSIYHNGGILDISKAHLASEFDLVNLTDEDILPEDVVIFGDRFRAIDISKYNYLTDTKVETVTAIGPSDSAQIKAIFTVSFDFGEGTGTLDPIETYWSSMFRVPEVTDASHPDGLSIVGWTISNEDYEYTSHSVFELPTPKDTVLTARWDAAVYVGGIMMSDGDYLASEASEVTDRRPAVGGYAYFKDGVLTLNGFSLSSPGYVIESLINKNSGDGSYTVAAQIFSAQDIIIELIGTNTLSSELKGSLYDDAYPYGILSTKALTIRGDGALRITSLNFGIHASDLTIDSGTVTLNSINPFAVALNALNFTLNGGKLTTISTIGISSVNVQINGGELNAFSHGGRSETVSIITDSFIMNDGILKIRTEFGINANQVTVNDGIIDISDTGYGITNLLTEQSHDSAFINITGGEIYLSTNRYGIFFSGSITVSGGTVEILSSYGIQLMSGHLTVSGGELSVIGDTLGIMTQDADVLISDGYLYVYGYNISFVIGRGDNERNLTVNGGYVDIYGESTGLVIEGALEVNGGHVCVSAGGEGLSAKTTSVSGSKTVLLVKTDDAESFEINSDEIAHVFTTYEHTVCLGKDLLHTLSESYYFDSVGHWRVCTNEDCVLNYYEGFDLHAPYAEYGYSEHTLSDEGSCECGYAVDGDILPELDTVLIIGDLQLKSGEYLDLSGNISNEKPDGGYLLVSVKEDAGCIILDNFTFTYSGSTLMELLPYINWELEVYGDNVLTLTYNEYDQRDGLTGYGILINGGALSLVGSGNLTVNADTGIFADCASLAVNAPLTVNARSYGISIDNYDENECSLNVNSTLVINAEREDGIHANNSRIFFESDADVTISAGDDGISLNLCFFEIDSARKVSITAEDDGINLLECNVTFTNTEITVVTQDDDGIDATDSSLSFNNINLSLNTDDHGIDIDYCELNTVESKMEINAGDDGIDAMDSNVNLYQTELTITAKDNGFDLVGSYDEYNSVFLLSTVNVTSSTNRIDNTSLVIEDSKVSIKATEIGINATNSDLQLLESETTVTSSIDGIIANDYATFSVNSGKLYIEASRYGIYGDMMMLTFSGRLDVSVRAAIAMMCGVIELGTYNDDSSTLWLIDPTFTGVGFVDDLGMPASYVTIISHDLALEKITKATDALDQILSDGGELDLVAGSIEELNGIINTLTNLEGEGRLDLIEKANEAINKALEALDTNLDQAKKELDDAIKAGDTELGTKITDLDTAIGAVESAYSAADKSLEGKLTEAQSTLDAAIKATEKKVDDAKAELEAALEALRQANETTNAQLAAAIEALEKANKNNESLKSEVEEMETELTEADKKAKTSRTVTTVVASTALTCNVGMIAAAIILERKKKLISSLFSGVFKK